MHILIIGGTGFLGYHAAHEFLRRGHTVTAVGRRAIQVEGGLFPPAVQVVLADVNALSDDAFRQLAAGHDALVFAGGADDRHTPAAPAYEYFYRINVQAAVRLVRLARAAGVQRGVILGSYLSHFERIWPHMRLAERHPYIRSRREQAAEAIAAAAPTMTLNVLELPYIFGAMPGRKPLWAPLIRYVRSPWPLFFPSGGANMVAVGRVAEAIVGAVTQGEAGARYLVGDENVPWHDWLARLARIAGRPKRVITVPTAALRLALLGVSLYTRLEGKEPGLNPRYFARLFTAQTYFDPAPARQALGFGSGGLDQAFADTVKAS